MPEGQAKHSIHYVLPLLVLHQIINLPKFYRLSEVYNLGSIQDHIHQRLCPLKLLKDYEALVQTMKLE